MLNQALLAGSELEAEIELETGMLERGIKRYRDLAAQAVKRGDGASLKPAERLMVHWFKVYEQAIRIEQREVAAGKPGKGRATYGRGILLLPSDRIALIAMHTLLSHTMANPRGAWLTTVAVEIGKAVNAQVNIVPVRKNKDAWKKLIRTDRRKFRPKHINRIANQFEKGARWPLKEQLQLGVALIDILGSFATCQDWTKKIVPAFELKTEWENPTRSRKIIRLTEPARKLIDDGHTLRQHLYPRYQPMLVEPLPWTEFGRGGYMKLRTTLVKRPTKRIAQALEGAELDKVYEAVNAMGATAWAVNTDILTAVKNVWSDGGGELGMPRADDLPLPPPIAGNINKEDRDKWKKEAAKIHRANAIEASNRMSFMFTLKVAEDFSAVDRWYQPHQIDFRGRAYPINLYLTHQGDDVCRGMMRFADAKPLGKRGLYWLKVHIANSWGIDKVPFDQRVEWTDSFVAEDRPDRWREAEKPWQFLAAYDDLVKAIQSGDPESYASAIPIQKDGSCNGLQHYAALGRDPSGAAAVNLIPGNSPADVYSAVCARVVERVARDAANGVGAAVALDGVITRKVVKQPVMTTVYGVTKVGARKQVRDQLSELTQLESKAMYACSMYLANTVMDEMGHVCVSAKQIMAWMTECARLISGDNRCVAWQTPLGLPCIQPYFHEGIRRVATVLADLSIPAERELKVKYRRQVNGFAPNFIHSIDATHLMMTATEMRKLGLSFAGVHDSYWTHAADVDAMDRVIREQFVALHSMPLIDNLMEYMRTWNPDLKLPDPPKAGTLDIRCVLDSPYFFS